ncbi:RHS repeat domain-containing protein [Paenibacillus puldeungensis]|uniref:RHS repeat domain-containing protein n=1 Tax=Paenibacillus puldeungensis TaxID=696536 RepID=A0ABW3RWS8_9BACL
MNRLQSVTEPSGKITTYAFDASGNREREKLVNGSSKTVINYEYDEQNRLTSTSQNSIEGTKQKVAYHYDNNGNLLNKSTETTKKVDPENPIEPTFGMFIYGQPNENPRIADIVSGVASYHYDVWNQLESSSTGSGTTLYQYNGEGLRTKKIANGKSTQYVYENNDVVLETDERGKQIAFNVYGGPLLTRTIGTEQYMYLYNGHADVTSLIDNAGNTKASYEYDAFGNIASSEGTVNNPVRYSGYQYDEESQLYYLNARYYDPKIARFLSEDTYKGNLNDPLSLNLYTYVSNNPLVYSDPTGHWQQRDSKLNVQAQASIIALTNSYYKATNAYERAAISKQADAIRNSAAAHNTGIVTPLQAQAATIISIVNKGISAKGYATVSDWNQALKSAGITTSTKSEPYVKTRETGSQTVTTTNIGVTNLAVTSYHSAETKKSGANLNISYNVTKPEYKFVVSVANEDVTLEQALMLAKTMERSGGKLSKKDLIKLKLNVNSSIDSLEMAYDFATKDLTISEAEILYRQEVVNPKTEQAFMLFGLNAATSSFRVGPRRNIAEPVTLTKNEYANVGSKGTGNPGTVGAQRSTGLATPGSNGAFKVGTELPGDAVILRGGVAKPKDLQANQALDTKNNTLSANGGMGVSNETLSNGLKNNQISIVSVGKLNDVGYKVVATPTANNPYHVSIYTPGGKVLTDTEAANLSSQFTQVPNPSLNK